jgi:hypothetical protein
MCLDSHMGISQEEEQGGSVVELLQTFCGLEDLFLMLPPSTEGCVILRIRVRSLDVLHARYGDGVRECKLENFQPSLSQ